jgi:hypothetical protein
MRAAELTELLRLRAEDYDRQARAALTTEMRAVFEKTAASFRWVADRIEAEPPRWLEQ